MTKQDAMTTFKKLFILKSRSRSNWKDMLDSLVSDKEITPRQGNKWYYSGKSPTTYFNGNNWVLENKHYSYINFNKAP